MGATGALATFWFQSPLGRFVGGVEGVTGTVQVMKYGQFGFGVCSSSKRPPFPSVKWRRKKKKGEMRGGGLGGFVVGETKSRCFPEL